GDRWQRHRTCDTRSRVGRTLQILQRHPGDETHDPMIRSKAQLLQHLLDDLGAHRDHDDFALIEHRLVALRHAHIGVSGCQRTRYGGAARRQHDRDVSLGGTEALNDCRGDRAGADKPQPHASRPLKIATPYTLPSCGTIPFELLHRQRDHPHREGTLGTREHPAGGAERPALDAVWARPPWYKLPDYTP